MAPRFKVEKFRFEWQIHDSHLDQTEIVAFSQLSWQRYVFARGFVTRESLNRGAGAWMVAKLRARVDEASVATYPATTPGGFFG